MHEIIRLITRHGAAVVFVIAFLEQIGAPVVAIPVIIVAAGMAFATGGNIPLLILLAIAGSLIADVIWFLLGRRFGYTILGFLCRISLSPDSCVRKTESIFERYGIFSLVFSKFVPGFSLIAPPLAGAIRRMSFPAFLGYDLIGAAIWAGSAAALGAIFHDSIDRLLTMLSRNSGTATAVVVALIAAFIAAKWWERHRFYRSLRMARISPGDLRTQLESGASLVVLDVRSRAEQQRDPRRIPGAIMVDAKQMEEQVRHLMPHQQIVLYCT